MSRFRESGKVSRQRRERDTLPAGRRIRSTREKIHFERRVLEHGAWAVPMPTIDPQIVRRSAAANERYGPDFRYGHYILVNRLPKVAALVGGVGAMMVGAQFKPTRNLLLRMKSPGDGPSQEQREKAWFKVRFVGEAGGKRVITEVSGGDPGYGETSKMLAESALCLVLDDCPPCSGVVTPAQALGNPLIKRLQAAGILFTVLEKKEY